MIKCAEDYVASGLVGFEEGSVAPKWNALWVAQLFAEWAPTWALK